MLPEVNIKGKPVSKSNTETVKKSQLQSARGLGGVDSYTEFRDKIRKMSFSEKETKT